MKYMNRLMKLSLLAASLRLVLAYLDPGSGSLLVQLLVAAIVGILATFRLWKTRVMRLFGMAEEPEPQEDNIDKNDQAQ